MIEQQDAAPRKREKVRIYGDDGSYIETEMTPELERWISRLDKINDAARQKEKRHRKRVKTFTDLGLNSRTIKKRFESSRLKGFENEGPHFVFTHFLGESRIWWGARLDDVGPMIVERLHENPNDDWSAIERPLPTALCECCGGEELEPHQACLRCNRTGMDKHKKMRPSPADLAKRAPKRAPRTEVDGLVGGVGHAEGREPKAEPKRPKKGKRKAALKGGRS